MRSQNHFKIPRYDDAITISECGAVLIWIISLDARQGYHQVEVRFADQEKLAFFTPSDEKFCFTVIPFGPTNAPSFYTAMMKDFKTECDDMFIILVTAMKTYNTLIIRVDTNQDVIIGEVKLVWGSKTIIDDILLWCDKKYLTLLLFTCVCEVFQSIECPFGSINASLKKNERNVWGTLFYAMVTVLLSQSLIF